MCTYVNGLSNIGSSSTYQKYFKLMTDIDLSEHYWDIVCNFHGVFDGNGHTISNMTIDTNYGSYSSTQNSIGLFSTIKGYSSTFTSVVKNLKIVNPGIWLKQTFIGSCTSSSIYMGILTGYCHSTRIENVSIINNTPYATLSNFSSSNISTTVYEGILCGYFQSGMTSQSVLVNIDIHDCDVSSSNFGTSEIRYMGGVVGYWYTYNLSYPSKNINLYNVSLYHGQDVSTTAMGGICGVAANGINIQNISLDVIVELYSCLCTNTSLIKTGGVIGYLTSSSSSNALKINGMFINRMKMYISFYDSNTDVSEFHMYVGAFSQNASVHGSSTDKDCIYVNSDKLSITDGKTLTTGMTDTIHTGFSFTGQMTSNYYRTYFNSLNWVNAVKATKYACYTYNDVLPSTEDDTYYVSFPNEYTQEIKSFSQWTPFIFYFHNAGASKYYDTKLSVGFYMYYKSPTITIPYPEKQPWGANYNNGSLYLTKKVDNEDVTIIDNLNFGDSFEVDSIENGFYYINIDSMSQEADMIQYKNSDSTMATIEKAYYKNTDGLLVPIIDYGYKTADGLI